MRWTGTKSDIVSEGDRHRDNRRWQQAARAYLQHLKANPSDADIWVQYAHAKKELGHLEAAEDAYRKATALRPDDFDAFLHLAHLLKRQKRAAIALEAFRQAQALGAPDDILPEIDRLVRIVKKDSKPQEVSHTYLFSLQDLFFYLGHHTTMSGIQRVQAGIALALLDMSDVDAGFILTDFTEALPPGSFWLLEPDALRAVIHYASGENVVHSKLKRLLADCEQSAVAITAGRGSTVVLLGAFWGMNNTVDRYLPAKREGARIAAYIYDIIPISHPEYCDARLVHDFTLALSDLALVCDYMLTISDFTRVMLDEFFADQGIRAIPTATVPLAHSLTGQRNLEPVWPKALQRLKDREFVAYVSTIEGRKNHSYVINVWRRLIADGVQVPDLVFVGRKGWRIDGLLDLLDGSRYLDGRVHIVHDLSDAELDAVYARSLFTVFTSFVEGWGLPVGESLMHHTPCVASSTSSIPEVGGDFVDYVDPLDVNDGVRTIGRLIQDRAYLDGRRAAIASRFRPRTWPEVARIFVDQMHKHEDLPVVSASLPTLIEGALFKPAGLVDPSHTLRGYVANPTRFLIVDSFYPPDALGTWMRGRFGELAFQTGMPKDEEVSVYLKLYVAPWFDECSVSALVGDARRSDVRSLKVGDFETTNAFVVRGRVGAGGLCYVTLEVEGTWEMPDEDEERDYVLGLAGLGFARSSNAVARADLLEALTLTVLSGPAPKQSAVHSREAAVKRPRAKRAKV